MTISEMIDVLKQFPPETRVIYRKYSDYAEFEPGDISLFRADEKVFVLRGGNVMETYPAKQWGDEVPVYIDVVTFPGN